MEDDITRYGLILNDTVRFYNNNQRCVEALNSFSKDSKQEFPLSIRFVEWFITKYLKNYPLIYYVNKVGGYKVCRTDEYNRRVNVHLEFRSRVKNLTKRYFDPFRRNDRLTFLTKDGLKIDTTLAQMCFVRWFHSDGLYQYMLENYKEINALRRIAS